MYRQPRHGCLSESARNCVAVRWIRTPFAIDTVLSKTRQAILRHLQVTFPERVPHQFYATSPRSLGFCGVSYSLHASFETPYDPVGLGLVSHKQWSFIEVSCQALTNLKPLVRGTNIGI